MRRHPLVPLLVLLVVAILVAGCGGSGGGSERKTKPPKGPRAITAIPPSDALTKDMGDQGAALTAAGCSFGAFDQESAEHVDTAADLHFDSFPPTSGTHYPDWAPYGLYTERIEDGYAVHDMEHGGVVVWFGTKVDTKTQDAVAG
ncbi:MAG: hypothetical protein JWM98_876, partial [Thermoleophilia bacterium]|nr:hypothetical protein [Thermoleophilia bacterium]